MKEVPTRTVTMVVLDAADFGKIAYALSKAPSTVPFSNGYRAVAFCTMPKVGRGECGSKSNLAQK